MAATAESLKGYDFGTVPRSPVGLDELQRLEQTLELTDADRKYLKMAAEVLTPQAEDMVNAWRERIGKQPHLAASFVSADGQPDDAYKAAVKPRFVQWVIDLCSRPFDQAWLDYQDEIGQRHTPAKKNQTDGAETPPVVPLRYVFAFTSVIMLTTRDFLARSGRSPEDVDRMYEAWTKAVMLSLSLWTRPYAKEGLW